MRFFYIYRKKLATIVLSFFCCLSYSFQNTQTIVIPHVKSNIVLDGILDDNIWQQANTIDLNIVNAPWNNTPSPFKTTAKIVENGDALLIAFIAEDPNPEQMLSYFGDRDTRWDDDLVGIKIDSQNNNRLNYVFISNTLGIQMDSIENNITNDENDLWDGIWQSYGRLTNTGYIVEMEIPFRILNFENSKAIKSWPIELFRIYPRDTWLRISHVPLDKDIACKTCQFPLAQGFKSITPKENIMVTPAVVARKDKTRDIYDLNDNWHDDSDVEIGIDLRWGINSNTLLNATINPDFSFIEADAGQLNINENFSLNYDEKRSFFLENNEYFSSNFDLVYTSNITAPDYGLKLTGVKNQHTYGIFHAQDQQTNFILPGNISSDFASINDESSATAIKYRYDRNENLSFGFISTLRQSSEYHNYVAGLDGKLQINKSNSILAQVITSNTEYPDDFYQDFCTGDECTQQLSITCLNYACPYNEQVNRANYQGDFSDQAFRIDYQHRSQFWDIDATHLEIGEDFRADLGFIPRTDYKDNNLKINRKFFADEGSLWQEASIASFWDIKHNAQDELLERAFSTAGTIDGPYQSRFKFTYTNSDEVGLRIDQSITDIADNTTLFELEQGEFYAAFKPTNNLYLDFKYTKGDKIDYIHNRLGDINELESYFSWFATQHLEIEMSHINSQLNVNNSYVYQANLIDSRISYQFDSTSRLKLNVIYCDIKRNLSNNPSGLFDERKKEFTTQLIYSYKINPQTVFYLGYSDNIYQDDYLDDLRRENKTFFSKISYAWMP